MTEHSLKGDISLVSNMHVHEHMCMRTSTCACAVFYMEYRLSLGLIAALASALSWSFVSCFYLILFFITWHTIFILDMSQWIYHHS